MKSILSLVVVVSFFLTTTPVFSDQPNRKLHIDCLYPSVQLVGKDVNACGSGTIVKCIKHGNKFHNVVVSCAHIFASPNYTVRVPVFEKWSTLVGYEEYDAIIYKTNKNYDLSVVLFVSDKPMYTAKIELDPQIFIGSDIFRIGYGLGLDQRLDYGKITSVSFRAYRNAVSLYRTSVYTVMGDSGSAFFHDYKVIAITQSIANCNGMPAFGISHAVPMVYLKIWNDEINNVLGFVYKDTERLPVIPFVQNKVKLYERGQMPWEKK